MTLPGSPGWGVPNNGPDDSINRRFRDLERKYEELKASLLGTNGMVLDDRAVIRTAGFDGDLVAETAGTQGWGADGDTFIVNRLVVRNGIIGNDALTNPVVTRADKNFTNAAATQFTTTPATVVSCSLTVPSGFTSATIIANGIPNGTNPLGSSDNLWSRIEVPGIGSGPGVPFGVESGLSVSAVTYYQFITAVTGGQVLTINVQAWTTVGTWPTGGSNTCTVSALGIFTR